MTKLTPEQQIGKLEEENKQLQKRIRQLEQQTDMENTPALRFTTYLPPRYAYMFHRLVDAPGHQLTPSGVIQRAVERYYDDLVKAGAMRP